MCFTISHRHSRAAEIYIGEKPKQAALKRLRERMDAGENVYDILEIPPEHEYYVNKIVAGLCPMSYAIYGRIMNLDEEDDFSE